MCQKHGHCHYREWIAAKSAIDNNLKFDSNFSFATDDTLNPILPHPGTPHPKSVIKQRLKLRLNPTNTYKYDC